MTELFLPISSQLIIKQIIKVNLYDVICTDLGWGGGGPEPFSYYL